MSNKKERLTVTVDRTLIKAGHAAVAAGTSDSLSAWVNLALTEQAAKEQRIAALHTLIAEYESKHGVITEEEVAAQQRADRRAAIVVRGPKRSAARNRRAKAA